MTIYEKILGGLLGAAVGDAMGAATEVRTMEQIREFFGGYVRDFIAPPKDTFARGREAGQITDDFSQAYYLAREIVNNGGKINEEIAKCALLKWSECDEYFIPFAGPTTRAAIMNIKGETVNNPMDFLFNNNGQASNGSAMRIAPIGMLNPGNIDKAIEDAILVCMPTHANNLSISGACAVSAAVSEAMNEDSNVYTILQAGIYGSKVGETMGRKVGKILSGPSVEKRINLSVELALRSNSLEEAMINISDYIGTGLHISEAVPAAFGLLTATKGDVMETIFASVNIGGDTDTIATISGAIAGTLKGSNAFPEGYLDIIESRNKINLIDLSKGMESVLKGEK